MWIKRSNNHYTDLIMERMNKEIKIIWMTILEDRIYRAKSSKFQLKNSHTGLISYLIKKKNSMHKITYQMTFVSFKVIIGIPSKTNLNKWPINIINNRNKRMNSMQYGKKDKNSNKWWINTIKSKKNKCNKEENLSK